MLRVAVVERAAVSPAVARHVAPGVVALLPGLGVPGQDAPGLGVTLALDVIAELDVSVLRAQAGLLDAPVSPASLLDGLERPVQALPERLACLALADSPPGFPAVPRSQACLVQAGSAPLPLVLLQLRVCLPQADSPQAEPRRAASLVLDGCPCLPPAALQLLLAQGVRG